MTKSSSQPSWLGAEGGTVDGRLLSNLSDELSCNIIIQKPNELFTWGFVRVLLK